MVVKYLRHLWLFLLVLSLFSCKKESGLFRLEGEFRNLNQAELYLIDPISGQKDTINVVRGRFTYESVEQDTALLMLMFPNYSLMPVFAHQGISLKLKADASHLREAELKGSEENDEMTVFRRKAAQMTPPEERQAAIDFITENPTSPVSLYLLRHYFIETQPDYAEAYRLCRLMVKANPRQLTTLQLYQQLKVLHAGAVGSRMPIFAVLDTKGRIVTNAQLRAQVNVVCLWSSWSAESRQLVTAVRKLQSKYPGKIALLAISIDATQGEGRDWLRRDTIEDYVVSDGRMWQTPLATSLGMTTIPSNIIARKNGRILFRDITKKEELEKKIEQLVDEQ